MTRYYPSQQEMTDPARLERVFRDIYDRMYKGLADGQRQIKEVQRVFAGGRGVATTGSSGSSLTPTSIDRASGNFTTLTAGQFSLTTSVWDDTQGNAIALRDVGVNVPTLTQIGTTGIYLPQFDIDDVLVFDHQFPHTLAETATVTVEPHVHWIGETSSANVVRWQLTYQWINNFEVLAASSTVITVDDAPTALQLRMADFPTVNKTGAEISSMFMGNITRITNGGTDYSDDVYFSFIDIHFLCDTLGSDLDDEKTYPS